MNALLKSLIIFLYPARCRYCGENLDPADGYYICKSCWQGVKFIEKPFCGVCGYPLDKNAALPDKITSCSNCPDGIWFRKARAIADYNSAVGEAIRLLKYSSKEVMAKPLAGLMFENMPKLLLAESYDYIIPVPLHKKKKRKRGYNQMELIGQWLSQLTGIPMEKHSLIKIRDNKPQTGLSGKEREANVNGVYDIRDPYRIADKRVLLIDDVMTTGATVNECARMLARKGKVNHVDIFTLTRRLKGDDYNDLA